MEFNRRRLRRKLVRRQVLPDITTPATVAAPAAPRAPRPPRGPHTRAEWLQAAVLLGVSAVVAGCLLVGGWLYVILRDLPDVTTLTNMAVDQSTVITDRDGGTLYVIHGDENRQAVPLADIASDLRNATISFEDKNFYTNPGIELTGIIRAGLGIVLSGGSITAGGGSTITQQLVKNIYLSPEQTATRKIREIVLAWRLDKLYSKDEILEMYLNTIPYGGDVHGSETAAKTFFGVSAKELTLLQAATMAVLPNAPSYYSPYGANKNTLTGEYRISSVTGDQSLTDVQRAAATGDAAAKTLEAEATAAIASATSLQQLQAGVRLPGGSTLLYKPGRKDHILSRMLEDGHITAEQQLQATKDTATLAFKPLRRDIKAPHFVFYVRDILEQRYGKDVVARGGLTVKTTLDPRLQEAAEKTLAASAARNLQYDVSNSALVSSDPRTGEVLAYVGGRDYWDEEHDGQVNIPISKRQPGSTFKSIVYALAFEKGYLPSTPLYDTPTKFGPDEPDNFDGKFQGPLSIRQALARSRNIPAAKGYFLVGGQSEIIPFARGLGIESLSDATDYGWPLALGSGEVTMLDMLRGYATFAAGGRATPLVSILEVRDSSGNILEKADTQDAMQRATQALSPVSAYLINSVLSDRNSRPAYWSQILTVPGAVTAAKTGTSNKRVPVEGQTDQTKWPIRPRDIWAVGYSTSLAAVVWSGNNNGAPLSDRAASVDVSGVLWQEFMREALRLYPGTDFPVPVDEKGTPLVVRRDVVAQSGLLPTEATPKDSIVNDVFPADKVPTDADTFWVQAMVDTASGQLATEGCPSPTVERRVFATYSNPLEAQYTGWQDGVQKWLDATKPADLLPKATSAVCEPRGADQLPTISLQSPASLTWSGDTIPVRVAVQAPKGVRQVQVRLQGQDAIVLRSLPFSVSLPAPAGNTAIIEVIAEDGDFYKTSRVFTLTRATGDAPAATDTLRLLSPAAGAEVPASSTLLLEVAPLSSSAAVSIFSDGVFIATLKAPTYRATIAAATLGAGAHTIRAESAGLSTVESRITVTAAASSAEAFTMVAPAANASVPGSSPTLFSVQMSPQLRAEATTVEIMAASTAGYDAAVSLYSVDFAALPADTRDIAAYITPDISGSYRWYVRVTKANGEQVFSTRRAITFQ